MTALSGFQDMSIAGRYIDSNSNRVAVQFHTKGKAINFSKDIAVRFSIKSHSVEGQNKWAVQKGRFFVIYLSQEEYSKIRRVYRGLYPFPKQADDKKIKQWLEEKVRTASNQADEDCFRRVLKFLFDPNHVYNPQEDYDLNLEQLSDEYRIMREFDDDFVQKMNREHGKDIAFYDKESKLRRQFWYRFMNNDIADKLELGLRRPGLALLMRKILLHHLARELKS